MSNVIYAVKTYELSAEDLTIKEVKLGRTSNIKSTMSQYNRSHREPEILDLWQPNENLTASQCEKGVLDLAEEYAHERRGETFRFLQDGYEKFSDNASLLLLPVSVEELKEDKPKETDKEENEVEERDDYTGQKPDFFVLNDEYVEVNSWRDLLAKVAKMVEEERDNFEKALKIKGRTRNYFSENPDNLRLANEIPGTSYYVEGNLSANQTVNIIERLLEEFNHNFEEDFKLGLK